MKQNEAIEIIMKGYNVFLTGAAGSGKTWVINECVSKLKETGKNIAVTATTGIAATHINGVTLHSWARLKIYKEKELFEKGDKEETGIEHIIKRDNIAVENIFGCHILIIDEVSMLNAYLLTAVDMICRGIKKNLEVPFGGIQVILSGDFFQLPPIPDPGRPMKYAFQSDSWLQNDFKICYLEEQYRQFDTKFITILNELRNNSLSASSLEALRSRLHASIDSTIKPIQMYPKNDAVDRINLEELGKIKEPAYRYKMAASGDKDLVNTLKKQCLAKEKLELKIGAPVLFIRNSTNKQYVNGTQGTVVGFKSLDSRFVKGVTYFEDDEDDEEDAETYENNLYPVVRTYDGRDIYATPEIWSFSKIVHYKETGSDGIVRTQIKEETLASIIQVPLILGWSISVHKCVSGDTLISTKEGLKYIKDISLEYDVEEKKYKECNILLWSNEGDIVADQIFNGGVVDGFKITTESGFSLIGKPEHPILIRDENGNEIWKKLSELVINDTAIMQKGFSLNGSNEIKIDTSKLKKGYRTVEYKIPKIITKELAWILGILIGDGCVSDIRDGRIDVTKDSLYMMEKFSKCMFEIFGIKITLIRPKNRNVYVAYCHSWYIRNFLEQIGLSFNIARNKYVPSCIFNTSPEIQKYFVQGLFDTDGGVGISCIHLTSSSEKLLREVQIILLNLNIISSFRASKKYRAYKIHITGINAVKYMNTIGFSEFGKRLKGEKRYGVSRCFMPKVQKGFFPDSKKVAKDLYDFLMEIYGKSYGDAKRLHLPVKEVSSFLTRVILGTCGISCEHITFLLDLFPDVFCNSKYEIFRTMFFEKIVSIEKTKDHVYDLHVPDKHFFIGNGFINHNSQGMSLDYAKMDLSQSFLKGMGYVAISRVRSLEGIILLGYNALALMVNPQIIAVDKVLREESENNRLALCSTTKEEFCESEEVEESLKEDDAFDNYRAELLTITKEFFRKSFGNLLIKDFLEIEELVDKLILDITQSRCALKLLERNFKRYDKEKIAK